jgi:hypothetical protein
MTMAFRMKIEDLFKVGDKTILAGALEADEVADRASSRLTAGKLALCVSKARCKPGLGTATCGRDQNSYSIARR